MGFGVVLGVLAFFGMAGLAFVVGMNARKAPAAWAEAGAAFGLVADPGPKIVLRGTVEGMPVVAQVVGRGAGSTRLNFSQVRVEAGAPTNVFFDTKVDTDFFAHLESALLERTATGDEAFDAKVRVHGPAGAVAALLTDEVREVVLAGAARVRIRLQDGVVYTEHNGLVREVAPMHDAIEVALDVARLVRS